LRTFPLFALAERGKKGGEYMITKRIWNYKEENNL